MAERTLPDDSSLDSIWGEVVFTCARLTADANAKEHAPIFVDLRSRVERVRGRQMDVWCGELVAQAGVNAADDALDDWVHSLDLMLSHIVAGETASPRYRRYFATSPSLIIRMGLDAELGKVRGWVASLATEPEAELQALGEKLKAIIAQGDAALEARRTAAAARTDHRVREISTIIGDINNARRSLYGMLAKKGAEMRLPKGWPDRFFQHAARTPKAKPQPVGPVATK